MVPITMITKNNPDEKSNVDGFVFYDHARNFGTSPLKEGMSFGLCAKFTEDVSM